MNPSIKKKSPPLLHNVPYSVPGSRDITGHPRLWRPTDHLSVGDEVTAGAVAKLKQHQDSPASMLARSSVHLEAPNGLWPGRSEIQQIAVGVFITNYFGARNFSALSKSRISHVLICAGELEEIFPKSLRYLKLENFSDNTGTSLQKYIEQALPWIQKAVDNDERVLLHCAAGSSRSGSILLAYLMWRQKISLEEALRLAQQSRPTIRPNPGFYEQLKVFEQSKENFKA